MPIHDWTRVEAGIFHAFHHRWISAISDALNQGLLPESYYALPEQFASGFGPDVLTLQESGSIVSTPTPGADAAVALLEPQAEVQWTAETDMEFYRRKQNSLVIRHVSGDRVVAMVEIVSPGNKSTRHAFASFLNKAAQLLDNGVHLLVLDLFPPTRRDPSGLHAALWDEIAGVDYVPPADKPLTVASYQSQLTVRALVQPVAVGDALPSMPLFLDADRKVMVPLEQTYEQAFLLQPSRWRKVLAADEKNN